MSYDVTFNFSDWEEPPEPWRNYTSNVSGMWAKAIGESLGEVIEQHSAPAELLPYLERGIAAMKADPDIYRAMNPPNGWGDYDGALSFLEWMANGCRAYPTARVTVWR